MISHTCNTGDNRACNTILAILRSFNWPLWNAAQLQMEIQIDFIKINRQIKIIIQAELVSLRLNRHRLKRR